MIDIYNKFFQLLRLVIGSSNDIPLILKEGWKSIYEIAQKQSLMGVIFDGIRKMSDATKASGDSMEMDINLLMNWMGICRQIEKCNHQLDEAVGTVTDWFEKKSFRSCILKGQGNALMYPCPAHRTPGDIDIWVSGKPSEVILFVHSIAPKEKASYHHIDFPAINGIPGECIIALATYRILCLITDCSNGSAERLISSSCIKCVLKMRKSLYQQRDLMLSTNLSISTIICFKKVLD